MRKDDPSSSRRPRRRKSNPASPPPPAEATVKPAVVDVDQDFGIALCLAPALYGRRASGA